MLDIGQNTAGAHISSHNGSVLNPSDDQGHANYGPQSTCFDKQPSSLIFIPIKAINHGAFTQGQSITPPVPSYERPQSLQRRKGKRLYASRYVPGATSTATPSPSNNSKDSLLHHCPRFYCTVCQKFFVDAYRWRRHEGSVHGFHAIEWVCMLDGPIIDGNQCAFCSELYPDLEHMKQHSILNCLSKTDSQRTFPGKDNLKQHTRQVHLTDKETLVKKSYKVTDAWSKNVEPDPRALWCGFCLMTFESIANRMDHIADHFRHGADINKWMPRPGTN
jgi:hypothetical protein